MPAIEPDDRYPGVGRREAPDVAASRCRRSNRRRHLDRGAEAIALMPTSERGELDTDRRLRASYRARHAPRRTSDLRRLQEIATMLTQTYPVC